jgi:predicted metal-dependent RNase
MATDKLYTVAGVSKLNGEYKVRFANDTMRIKVLAKHGHEDITLIELPGEMSKLDAVKFLKTVDEFQGASEQSAIADYLDRKDEKPAKVATKAKAPAKAPAKAAPKTKKVTVPADAEDAPF